jgi:hypothetical protein
VVHAPVSHMIFLGMIFVLIVHYVLFSSMVLALCWSVMYHHHHHVDTGAQQVPTRSILLLGVGILYLALDDELHDESTPGHTFVQMFLVLLIKAAPSAGACELVLRLFEQRAPYRQHQAAAPACAQDPDNGMLPRMPPAQRLRIRVLRHSGFGVCCTSIVGAVLLPVIGHFYFHTPSSFLVYSAMVQLVAGIAWLLVTRISFSQAAAPSFVEGVKTFRIAWSGAIGRYVYTHTHIVYTLLPLWAQGGGHCSDTALTHAHIHTRTACFSCGHRWMYVTTMPSCPQVIRRTMSSTCFGMRVFGRALRPWLHVRALALSPPRSLSLSFSLSFDYS